MPGPSTVAWIVAGSVLTALACFAIAWWAVYRLNQERRATVEQQTAGIERLLAQARDSQNEIDREAQTYPRTPPPFYRSTFEQLGRSQAAVAQAIEQHAHTFEELRERAAPEPDHPLRRFFAVLGAERRFWRDQSEAVQALEQLVRKQVVGGLSHTRALLRELRAKPLVLAQNARELEKKLDRATRIAADLEMNGVHGETFLAQYSQLHIYRQQFDKDPIAFFVQNTEATIMRHAGLHDVQQAGEALAQIQEPCLATIALLHNWQTLHYEFEQALQEFQEVQHQITSRLNAIPPSVDISSLSAAWDAHRAPAPQLAALFASPTVQALQQGESVLQIVKAGYELIRRITEVESRYWHLCELIQIMITTLNQVQAVMIETAQANAYPLAWADYPIVFSQLAQVLTQIGMPDTPRTPDRLEQDVQRASALSHQVDSRRAEVNQIVEQYQALVLLLKQPELSPDRGWFEYATRLQQQSSAYASQNWPRRLAVERLKDDIAALDKRWRQWVPETPHEQLSVSQIQPRVEQVATLGEELAFLSERLEQVEAQLVTMQQAETSALKQLEQAGQILAQFEQLTADTQPPLGGALARHRSQVLDYRHSQRTQIKALERKDRDRVARKVDQAGKWHKALDGVWTTWLNALHADVEQREQRLKSDLERLLEIAPFDAEPVMAAAIKLFDTQPSRGSTRAQGTPLAPQIEQTQTALQRREQIARAREDVRRYLWTPIENLVARVNETRQNARDQLEALQTLTYENSSRSNWSFPCDTRSIANMLDEATRQEERLRETGNKLSRVSRQLEEIAAQYNHIIAQAKTDSESIYNKRQTLDDLLAQIEAWQDDLEAYRRHTDDREIARGIRARLDHIASELDRLHDKTRERHPISFEDLERQLEQIKTTFHTAVPYGRGSDAIPVDEIESRKRR